MLLQGNQGKYRFGKGSVLIYTDVVFDFSILLQSLTITGIRSEVEKYITSFQAVN